MWKYFFLGLLVGWLVEWIIDWIYWRRGIDDVAVPEGSAGIADRVEQPHGIRPQAAATGAPAPAPAPALKPEPALKSEPEPEPNAGRSTTADTSAGRVATGAAMGAAGAVSTTSATLTSRAPVYRQEDLEAVVGIGPKIGAMLRNNGITTFSHLAATSTWELERIVESTGEEPGEAGVDTWAVQARLAIAQNWEELARLQEELPSGDATNRREG